jgi:ribonucleoside-diphosphate reductase alpha chain
MDILKRDGTKVKFTASKVQTRVEKASKGLKVDPHTVLLGVYSGIADNMRTYEIDELIAKVSAGYTTLHGDYSKLSARILESSIEKTVGDFFAQSEKLYNQNILTEEQFGKISKWKNTINALLELPPIEIDYLGLNAYIKTYLLRDINGNISETPHHSRIRLATFFAENEEDVLENYNTIVDGWSPPTPTLCNTGATEGQLASCQLHYLKGDSLDGIMDSAKDFAISSKNKAGIGVAGYNQRAKGSKSSKGWAAAGVVQNMKIVNEVARFFDQGGKRPGSVAWYMTPWHKEIFSFLQARKVNTHESVAARDMFYAIFADDVFMEAFLNKDKYYLFCPNELKKAGVDLINTFGDEFKNEYFKAVNLFKEGQLDGEEIEAEKLMTEIYVTQIETGMPYIGFKDNINRPNPQRNIGTIKSSNLCVSGDTKILTDFGYIEIQELEGQFVNVWNGEEFSEVEVFKTGENKQLLNIITDSGYELKCTPEHKFYIQKGYNRGIGLNKLEILEKRAFELEKGDKLIKFNLPVIEGGKTLKYAYTQGFFSGDGYSDENVLKSVIYLYGDKKQLLPRIDARCKYSQTGRASELTDKKAILNQENQDRIVVFVPEGIINDKSFVPNSSYTISSRLEWLAGVFDSDGTVTNNNGSQSIKVGSINKEFLKDIQLMLQTLGCDSKVTFARSEGVYELPANDGTNTNKLYNCKEVNRLLINGNSMYKLIELGLVCHRLKWEVKKPNRECSQFIKIKEVQELPDLYDVFCFTEPKRHLGMFNGVLTGQCHEIVQYTDPQTVAVCVLSSVVMFKFINTDGTINHDKLRRVVHKIVNNLNIAIDKNVYTIPEAERGAKQQRAIAIGSQGVADTFFMLGMEYGSPESLELIKDFQEALHYYTIEGSMLYSKKVGKRLFQEDSIYPIEKGQFHWEHFDVETKMDWESLRKNILKYGVANSMFNAQMPTATSSQVNMATESDEQLTNNIYSRRLNSGEIIVINRYLVKDFEDLGIWSEKLSNELVMNDGSVQNINLYDYIKTPTDEQIFKFEKIRSVYKTIWETSQKKRTDVAVVKQPFNDQAMSMNVFYSDPNISQWSSALVYAWKKKLKTGNYYCRIKKQTANKNLAMIKTVEKPSNSIFECDGCSS